MPNDRILSVNLKKVTELGTEQLHAIFKSNDGKGIILEIFRHGFSETEFVVLFLKRRI